MSGYQFASFAVGFLFGGWLLTEASVRDSPRLRWVGLTWLVLWCGPPLVMLWIRSITS